MSNSSTKVDWSGSERPPKRGRKTRPEIRKEGEKERNRKLANEITQIRKYHDEHGNLSVPLRYPSRARGRPKTKLSDAEKAIKRFDALLGSEGRPVPTQSSKAARRAYEKGYSDGLRRGRLAFLSYLSMTSPQMKKLEREQARKDRSARRAKQRGMDPLDADISRFTVACAESQDLLVTHVQEMMNKSDPARRIKYTEADVERIAEVVAGRKGWKDGIRIGPNGKKYISNLP